MSAAQAAKTLGDLREGNRQGAIAALARSGQIASPVSGSDGALLLSGTTQGARAGSIGELATLFKTDLSGQEAEAILGSETTLSEGNRQGAIAALARGKRFGPSLGEDAALALKGTTQGARAGSIGELAPYLRAGLSGQAIATILGGGPLLSEGNRQGAIAAIARSGKKPLPLSRTDGTAILQGCTQGARAGSIGELALLFKLDLSGQEAEAILGPETTLSEGNRLSAIAALARAKRFGPSLGEDAALALKGTTQGARAGAIGEIAYYLRGDLAGRAIAAILGDARVLSEGNRLSAIAALVRAGKLHAGLSAEESVLILDGTSGQARVAAIAEMANATKAPIAQRQPASAGASQAASAATSPCDAPRVAIDKPAPTCREQWQTEIFRAQIGKIFFATNQYIDQWQESADTGAKAADWIATLAETAMFADTTMGLKGGAKKAALILTKGNSLLLMLGFDLPEETLGVSVAKEAVGTIRSEIEALVESGLGVAPSPLSLAPSTIKLFNSLLAYANTVRYSRLRNTYTVALEYLRLLYRMGGDQAAFAQSLGLALTASVPDCVRAVNKKAFGFPTQWTDASAYNPALVEKVVNHWAVAISDYAALKAP